MIDFPPGINQMQAAGVLERYAIGGAASARVFTGEHLAAKLCGIAPKPKED
jgi:hypothetical protein